MGKAQLCLLAVAAAVGAASAKTVKVSSFGYDPTDSTAFIRAAAVLASAGSWLFVHDPLE